MRLAPPVLAAAALLAFAAPAAAGVRDTAAVARAPLAQLERADAVSSFGARFVRFRQEVGGLPVLGAEAVVTEGPGPNDLLVDDTRTRIDAPGEARVARSDAVAEARRAPGASGAARAELAILPDGDGGRLVWRVLLSEERPTGAWEVLVDARGGSVVRVRDLLLRATDQAELFDPNPVETQGSTAGFPDAASDSSNAALEDQQRLVALPRLTGCLTGPWVQAVVAVGNVCRDWAGLTRANLEFEAVMAYFHVDRTQAYIQSLGFTNVLNRQVLVRANGFEADDQSFYRPDVKDITLGTGGVDDGEDADVIVHEYGHAIQDDQVPGFAQGEQDGAMGEGFGDYLAAAMSANFQTSNAGFDPCIGEWDVPGACLRRTDNSETAQSVAGDPCFSEVHCAGEAWSGALWDIRTLLGGAATDRLVIQSHFSLTPQATFQDGARALLAADAVLYGGANRELISGVVAARGLASRDQLDDGPAGSLPLALPGSVSGTLDAAGDPRDVYRIALSAGQGVVVTSGGTGEVNLRLYRPGTTRLGDPAMPPVAFASTGGAAERLVHRASTTGNYFVEVSTHTGAAGYTVQAAPDDDADGFGNAADVCPAVRDPDQLDRDRDGIGDECDRFPRDRRNDADRDGRGAASDNCPAVANRDQRDWDGDDRGDACDASARVSLLRARRRGSRIELSARVQPLARVAARDVRFALQRRSGGGWRSVSTVRASKKAGGRVSARVRLGSGSYRFRAVLKKKGLNTRTAGPRRFGL